MFNLVSNFSGSHQLLLTQPQIIITLHALITNYEEELDVMPYIKNPQELTIWSNEYFLQLAERIVWKQE